MRRQRGFTLIELLIALTLFAIMSLLAWRGLDTVLQSRVALETPGRAALELAAAWTQLELDLQAARTVRTFTPAAGNPSANAPVPQIMASTHQLSLLRTPAQCAGCWEGVVYDIVRRDGNTVLRRRTTGLYAESEAAVKALTALARPSAEGLPAIANEHVMLRGATSMRIATWRESQVGLGAWSTLGAASDSVFPAAPLPRQGRAKYALKVEWQLGTPWDGWVSKVVLLENRW